MSRIWQISRRTALRGLGTALALPLLDVMTPAVRLAAAATRDGASLPKRLAFLFVPNGVNPYHWRPQRLGYGYDLTSILEPLRAVQDDVSVLTGLTHDKGRANGDGPGDHARSASVFLTGAQPRKTSSGNIRSGISVDQLAAGKLGQFTKFPSLELGCESGRNTGNCDSGYSCAYSHNIAWASPTTPLGKEIDPRLVFERLFGDESKEAQSVQDERTFFRRSLLDYVSDDARRLQSKLGLRDQQKLDEYLTAVRSIERRIEISEVDNGARAIADLTEKPAGIPEDFGEHIRLKPELAQVSALLPRGARRVVLGQISEALARCDLGLELLAELLGCDEDVTGAGARHGCLRHELGLDHHGGRPPFRQPLCAGDGLPATTGNQWIDSQKLDSAKDPAEL